MIIITAILICMTTESFGMGHPLTRLMHLLEFTDSAFPVGTFSFSNGLETAVEVGLVRDAATLEAYARGVARQAAFCDGVAALHAHRRALAGDWTGVCNADGETIRCKMSAEARQMTRRMGRKLSELALHLLDVQFARGWLERVAVGATPGCYPVVQGVVFAVCGISESELFASHQYGVINMVLGAALRCLRVSHYDTQGALFRLSKEVAVLYAEVADRGLEDMQSFVPQIDLLASLHEKGKQRLFMN